MSYQGGLKVTYKLREFLLGVIRELSSFSLMRDLSFS